MSETRVKKYATYRKQIEKSVEVKERKETKTTTKFLHTSSTTNTTTTLPLDQIVEQEKLLSEEEIQLKKQHLKLIFRNILIVLGVIALITFIVILGIILFK